METQHLAIVNVQKLSLIDVGKKQYSLLIETKFAEMIKGVLSEKVVLSKGGSVESQPRELSMCAVLASLSPNRSPAHVSSTCCHLGPRLASGWRRSIIPQEKQIDHMCKWGGLHKPAGGMVAKPRNVLGSQFTPDK